MAEGRRRPSIVIPEKKRDEDLKSSPEEISSAESSASPSSPISPASPDFSPLPSLSSSVIQSSLVSSPPPIDKDKAFARYEVSDAPLTLISVSTGKKFNLLSKLEGRGQAGMGGFYDYVDDKTGKTITMLIKNDPAWLVVQEASIRPLLGLVPPELRKTMNVADCETFETPDGRRIVASVQPKLPNAKQLTEMMTGEKRDPATLFSVESKNEENIAKFLKSLDRPLKKELAAALFISNMGGNESVHTGQLMTTLDEADRITGICGIDQGAAGRFAIIINVTDDITAGKNSRHYQGGVFEGQFRKDYLSYYMQDPDIQADYFQLCIRTKPLTEDTVSKACAVRHQESLSHLPEEIRTLATQKILHKIYAKKCKPEQLEQKLNRIVENIIDEKKDAKIDKADLLAQIAEMKKSNGKLTKDFDLIFKELIRYITERRIHATRQSALKQMDTLINQFNEIVQLHKISLSTSIANIIKNDIFSQDDLSLVPDLLPTITLLITLENSKNNLSVLFKVLAHMHAAIGWLELSSPLQKADQSNLLKQIETLQKIIKLKQEQPIPPNSLKPIIEIILKEEKEAKPQDLLTHLTILEKTAELRELPYAVKVYENYAKSYPTDDKKDEQVSLLNLMEVLEKILKLKAEFTKEYAGFKGLQKKRDKSNEVKFADDILQHIDSILQEPDKSKIIANITKLASIQDPESFSEPKLLKSLGAFRKLAEENLTLSSLDKDAKQELKSSS